MKSCGSCGLCCKLMAIPALEKPAHSWCPKYVMRSGCSIYEDRPEACRTFICQYLLMPDLGDDWRPDRARFMMWIGREARRLIVEVDPASPLAWRKPPYYAQLKAWSDRNGPAPLEVTVRVGDRVTVVFPEADIELGAAQNLPIESGYAFEGGAYRPFARYTQS